jgi:hypothetical protein
MLEDGATLELAEVGGGLGLLGPMPYERLTLPLSSAIESAIRSICRERADIN